jgi:hypothetical protein
VIAAESPPPGIRVPFLCTPKVPVLGVSADARPTYGDRENTTKAAGETMPSATARVATARSSRYLTQLCEHLNILGQRQPQIGLSAQWSDTSGVIDFGRARCTLRAEPDALLLVAEADAEARLGELRQRLTERIEQIGRRDGLRVVWDSPEPAASGGAAPHHGTGHRHMTEPSDPHTPERPESRYDDEPRGGLPRWAKITAIVVGIVVLLMIIMSLVGAGEHGPGRHF